MVLDLIFFALLPSWIKFDKESGRLSLGIKQLQEDPWSAIEAHYPKALQHKQLR